jgi:hypothetical protein
MQPDSCCQDLFDYSFFYLLPFQTLAPIEAPVIQMKLLEHAPDARRT